MDIIMNFLALVIIADFDETFFMTTRGEPMAELIRNGELELPEKEEDGKTPKKIQLDEILKLQVTTSKDARP